MYSCINAIREIIRASECTRNYINTLFLSLIHMRTHRSMMPHRLMAKRCALWTCQLKCQPAAQLLITDLASRDIPYTLL